MIAFNLKDWIALSGIVLSAGIGTASIFLSWNQRRVKLRVIPKYADNYPNSMASSTKPKGKVGDLYWERACIEVINLSTFPVTIAEIGITYPDDPQKKTLHAVGVRRADGTWLPWRLEPRQAETGEFPPGVLKSGAHKVYARTDCGKISYGTSPAFKEMVRRVC